MKRLIKAKALSELKKKGFKLDQVEIKPGRAGRGMGQGRGRGRNNQNSW